MDKNETNGTELRNGGADEPRKGEWIRTHIAIPDKGMGWERAHESGTYKLVRREMRNGALHTEEIPFPSEASMEGWLKEIGAIEIIVFEHDTEYKALGDTMNGRHPVDWDSYFDDTGDYIEQLEWESTLGPDGSVEDEEKAERVKELKENLEAGGIWIDNDSSCCLEPWKQAETFTEKEAWWQYVKWVCGGD